MQISPAISSDRRTCRASTIRFCVPVRARPMPPRLHGETFPLCCTLFRSENSKSRGRGTRGVSLLSTAVPAAVGSSRLCASSLVLFPLGPKRASREPREDLLHHSLDLLLSSLRIVETDGRLEDLSSGTARWPGGG